MPAVKLAPRMRAGIRALLYILTFGVVTLFTALTYAGWNNDLVAGAGIYVNLPSSIFLIMLIGDVLAASGLVLVTSALILRIIERANQKSTNKKIRIYKPGEE